MIPKIPHIVFEALWAPEMQLPRLAAEAVSVNVLAN
jgi:hypothetical protein